MTQSTLIYKDILTIIHRKFHVARFTIKDVVDAVSYSYDIPESVLRNHVRYLHRNGVLGYDGERYYFMRDEGWGGRLH